jgi:hypothetical protein
VTKARLQKIIPPGLLAPRGQRLYGVFESGHVLLMTIQEFIEANGLQETPSAPSSDPSHPYDSANVKFFGKSKEGISIMYNRRDGLVQFGSRGSFYPFSPSYTLTGPNKDQLPSDFPMKVEWESKN